MRQTRIQLRDCFIQNHLDSGVTSFNSPMKRNNLKLSISTGRTIKMKIGREASILQVNRNIMPQIISWSVNSGRAVDFKEGLRYLLCPVPPNIAFSDEIKRSTAKSKFLKGVWVLRISHGIVSNIAITAN